jgi:hypothetical protein
VTVDVTGFVRDLLKPRQLCDPFMAVLESFDQSNMFSALAVRKSLATVIVSDLHLLQRNFSRHSVSEFATAQTLRSVASTMKPTPLQQELLRHSEDEFRHSKMFRALANSLTQYSGFQDPENYEWILENDREFVKSYSGDVIEFVCDVLAAEIRTYFFLSGYVHALEQDKSAPAAKIDRVLRPVLDDECRHVRYTAAYINDWMEGGEHDLGISLQRSFRHYEKNSWIEIATTAQVMAERI